MTAILPPPVVFNHKETLHRIELPPLAHFLHSLTIPAQLIKLNDILDRYRTPSSVHRVDVREVASSELPPCETIGDGAAVPTQEESGQPIELDEGTSIDEYRATSRAVRTALYGDAPSPEATHPLPPTGPRRRVRELRVDLRSLDAAALFALEKWRRHVLQLEALPFDHPDSVWYQSEPTPEPNLEHASKPEVDEIQILSDPSHVVKRPVGRPRNSTKSASVQVESELAPTAVIAQKDGVEGGLASGPSLSINDVEAFDAMMDRLESVSDSEIPLDTGRASEDGAIDDDVVLVDTTRLASGSNELAQSRSPTPHQLLPDGFDRDAGEDSDYAPEPTPPPRRRRTDKIQSTNTSTIATPAGSAFTELPGPAMLQPASVGAEVRAVTSAFTKLPSPEPLRSTHTSGFTRVPSPVPLMAVASGSRPTKVRDDVESEVAGHHQRPSRSPTRRVSLTPSRRSISPQKHQRIGASSTQPIELSASPEVIPTPQSAHIGFVPFVREQMRIPDSVAAGRSKPSWLHDPTSRPDDDDEPRDRGVGPSRKASRPIKRARMSIELDPDNSVSVDEQPQPPVPPRQADADEWADFRF